MIHGDGGSGGDGGDSASVDGDLDLAGGDDAGSGDLDLAGDSRGGDNGSGNGDAMAGGDSSSGADAGDAGTGDETPGADTSDLCPDDPDKTEPGLCGCGVADIDTDLDDTPDCDDGCPLDPDKTAAGLCGCGVEEQTGDRDRDLVIDCLDACPDDITKTLPGLCGCGMGEHALLGACVATAVGCGDLVEEEIGLRWSSGSSDGATTWLYEIPAQAAVLPSALPPGASYPSLPALPATAFRGTGALRAYTNSGFDWWLRLDVGAASAIDVTGYEELRFDVRAYNPNPLEWQGPGPVVRLRDVAGSWITYTPTAQHLPTDGASWRAVRVPLAGDAAWVASGAIDVSQVQVIDIHADTWEYGFAFDLDAVTFEHAGTVCGCGAELDADADADGIPECEDACPGIDDGSVVLTDDFGNPFTLAGYESLASLGATGYGTPIAFAITGGELVAPGSDPMRSDVLLAKGLTMVSYTVEVDARIDARTGNSGLFGLVWHAAADGRFIGFAWNGNPENDPPHWQVEKQTDPGTAVYLGGGVGTGPALPTYTPGDWVHLRVTVLNDTLRAMAAGELVYELEDVATTDIPALFPSGRVGLRAGSIADGNNVRFDNLRVTCP